MMKIKIVFLVLTVAAVVSSCGGVSEKQFPSRSVVVNGTEYNYRIYVPENRDPSRKIPVMLYLHGSGSRGNDNQAQLAGISSVIRRRTEDIAFAIVMPQCRPDTFWAGEMTDQAMAALEKTVKEFNGDESRLYLAGYSMGGYGTWQTAVAHPKTFAALVPIAGGVVPNGLVSDRDMRLLAPTVRSAANSPDPYRAFAEAIGSTPVWVFHGGSDDVVPAAGARKMVAVMQSMGKTNVNYTELGGVGHGSLEPAFDEPGLFEWLSEQQLKLEK